MANTVIDPRLMAAASFVRAGAVFADIGTDHGYLPVFLLSRGIATRAVLSDVNAGPLSSARENVAAAGLSHLCDFLLTDGATALEGYGITDYAICGMGGELIADIIARAPHLCDPNIRLIVQPMTRQEHLRRAVYEMGFEIEAERYSTDDGRYYVTLLLAFRGTPCEISDELAYLGPRARHTDDRAEYRGYLRTKQNSLTKAYEGRRKSGQDDPKMKHVLDLIGERINELEQN